jgi:homoserine acetyltransferase
LKDFAFWRLISYSLIGGSVGGGIAWEILALEPKLAQNFIPIATDWKADWLIANCYAGANPK